MQLPSLSYEEMYDKILEGRESEHLFDINYNGNRRTFYSVIPILGILFGIVLVGYQEEYDIPAIFSEVYLGLMVLLVYSANKPQIDKLIQRISLWKFEVQRTSYSPDPRTLILVGLYALSPFAIYTSLYLILYEVEPILIQLITPDILWIYPVVLAVWFYSSFFQPNKSGRSVDYLLDRFKVGIAYVTNLPRRSEYKSPPVYVMVQYSHRILEISLVMMGFVLGIDTGLGNLEPFEIMGFTILILLSYNLAVYVRTPVVLDRFQFAAAVRKYSEDPSLFDLPSFAELLARVTKRYSLEFDPGLLYELEEKIDLAVLTMENTVAWRKYFHQIMLVAIEYDDINLFPSILKYSEIELSANQVELKTALKRKANRKKPGTAMSTIVVNVMSNSLTYIVALVVGYITKIIPIPA